MLVTLSDKSCSELWKLSCIQVACSHFYFTWEQALQVGRGNSELVPAGPGVERCRCRKRGSLFGCAPNSCALMLH